MAYRRTITDEQELRFEKELLSALQRDPGHSFTFDKSLEFISSRYGCRLRAVNVFLSDDGKDIVFVGSNIGGGGDSCVDWSKGYPVVNSEIKLPFHKVFTDLRNMQGVDPTILISKSRRAVIDKCLRYPLRNIHRQVLRDGRFCMDDFSAPAPKVKGGKVTIGSIYMKEGLIYLEPDNDTKEKVRQGDDPRGILDLRLTHLSLSEIQDIGSNLLAAQAEIQNATRDYLDIKGRICPDGRQVSERDIRLAEESALRGIYEKGYPIRVLHAVASRLSLDNSTVFDDMIHNFKDVQQMMQNVKKGQPFGFKDKTRRKIG